MNNRNSMLYGLYTMEAKYVYMWYKERSSEEYNEWFKNLIFQSSWIFYLNYIQYGWMLYIKIL